MDDEEDVFAPRPSCHQIVSVTAFCIDRCGDHTHIKSCPKQQQQKQQQQAVYPKLAHFSLCVTCDCKMDLRWQPVTGAAQRRKGRWLRAALRHERQSIAMALAEFTHHSSRGQRMARAGGWVARGGGKKKYTAKLRKHPPPGALLPRRRQRAGARGPAAHREADGRCSARRPGSCPFFLFARWTPAGSPRVLLSAEEGDDCVQLGGMCSSRSPRPSPRFRTTAHSARRRPGPGRRRASCTTRTRTGRLTSRCSSACTRKSPAGGGLPAWQSRRGR